ncbi:uncharacterized protein PV06_09800 [Exophiala oligosperma]|uniref:Survival Motor Neuron Gemin2-binding domain-containing protein n=1 Tax=Exophiala oligosperma TaxID=215243 RepID=A0A0D2D5Z6_9EURO|nr:uncharacterized protein PV06_09800 [Exophiala oligosperma]KIW37815.1 hypothetical protein PV06_09800 [Exophiala oligosperma]
MPRSRSSKKVKTKHHGAKAKAGGDLSQAEIWDDSALIRSWNDAVAEYEYYHSIHAKGEDVEEILRRAENGELDDEDVGGGGGGGGGASKGVSGEWHDVDQNNVTVQDAVDNDDDDEVEDGEVPDDSELLAAKTALTQRVTSEASQTGHVEQRERYQQPTATTTKVVDSSTTSSIPTQHDHAGYQNTIQNTTPTMGPNLPTTNEQDPDPISTTDQTLENIKMAYYWAGYYSGLHDGQRQSRQGGGGGGV